MAKMNRRALLLSSIAAIAVVMISTPSGFALVKVEKSLASRADYSRTDGHCLDCVEQMARTGVRVADVDHLYLSTNEYLDVQKALGAYRQGAYVAVYYGLARPGLEVMDYHQYRQEYMQVLDALDKRGAISLRLPNAAPVTEGQYWTVGRMKDGSWVYPTA